MNRKRVLLALVLGLALMLLCCISAQAADDPLKVSMELSKNKFTAPETITVSISVSNVGEGDIPSPVTLYYPSGKQVEEFGAPVLSVGVTKSWSGTWKVTQAELDAGRITFSIRYSVYNDEDELVNKQKNFSKRLIYSAGEPTIDVKRTIMPLTAQKGQEVTVTYDLENTGEVDITSVTIKENSSISKTTGSIEEGIPAGGKARYTFTATMGSRDITSAATVTYKAGGKSYTSQVEAMTIRYGEVKLSASLSADKKGGAPGDTVKLTLKLKNSGNVDFTDVKVTDAILGEVFSGEKVPKGETVTLEKELTITETQDLQFTVQAVNETGEPVETATGRVNIIATDPTQQIVLNVEASADRDVVHRIPGTVRFTVSVRNDSAVDVENITVRAVNTAVYVFDSIPAGATRSFARDMDVSMPGTFQFTASCKDQLSQTLSFASNTIPISFAEPTPVPTEAPLVTPPAPVTQPVPEDLREPEWLDQVESVAGVARWIFAGITGVLLVLLLIGAVRRGRSRNQSRKAMDHLDGANYRDYSQPPRGRKRNEITGNERNEPPAPEASEQVENTAQDSELMAETLKRLYNTPETGEAQAPSGAEAAPAADAEAAPETAEAAAESAPAEPTDSGTSAEKTETAEKAETAEKTETAEKAEKAEAAPRRRARK